MRIIIQRKVEIWIEESYDLKDESERLDILENPLLCNCNEKLSLSEKSIIQNLSGKEYIDSEFYTIKTKTGKLLVELNINDFDVFEYEQKIDERISNYNKSDLEGIVDMIYNIFLKDIVIISNEKDNLNRLENKSARNFYNMFISWRKNNISMAECIWRLNKHWSSLNEDDKKFIYVGKSFGEIKRKFEDRLPLYVNLNEKSDKEIINLAIVRFKEENDFVDYYLFKYIDLLYKVQLVSEKDYNLIHYGTDNKKQIFFQRDGISKDLSKILTAKYFMYIEEANNEYVIKREIFNNFEENDILRYELECYLK